MPAWSSPAGPTGIVETTTASAGWWRRRAVRPDSIVQAAITVAIVALVALPIVPIVVQSLHTLPLYEPASAWTLSKYVILAADRQFWSAVGNTAVFAVASTLVAQLIGAAAAILVARTDLPARRLFGAIMLWPLYVSHLVLALGWIISYGPSGYVTLYVRLIVGDVPWSLYTLGGLSAAAGFSMAPLTFLYCVGAARTVDASLENAARLCGAGPLRALLAVTVPLLRPALVSSAFLNFILAIELFVMPLLLGGPSGLEFLTTFIYTRGFEAARPDPALVAAVAVVLLGFVTVLVLIQNQVIGDGRKFVTVSGKAARPRILPLGPWKWPIAALFAAYLALAVLAVVGGLILRAFVAVLTPFVPIADALTLANFAAIFEYPQYVRSIWNTIGVALFGGLLGTLLVAAGALVCLRSAATYRSVVGFAAVYPRAVPGILVGMGLLWAAAWLPGLALLQNTILILVVGFVMRHLPTGWAAVHPALLQISRDHDRAAQTAGAGWVTIATRILAPQLRPALFACFALLFIHFLKEYAVAIFLFAPGSEVLGTTMLSFWIKGDTNAVAALAVIQIAIVVAFMALFRLVAKVRLYD